MTDEYVEEIHRIREKTYEVIKEMTSSEMSEYFHQSAERLERRIAECREQKAAEQKTVPSDVPGR